MEKNERRNKAKIGLCHLDLSELPPVAAPASSKSSSSSSSSSLSQTRSYGNRFSTTTSNVPTNFNFLSADKRAAANAAKREREREGSSLPTSTFLTGIGEDHAHAHAHAHHTHKHGDKVHDNSFKKKRKKRQKRGLASSFSTPALQPSSSSSSSTASTHMHTRGLLPSQSSSWIRKPKQSPASLTHSSSSSSLYSSSPSPSSSSSPASRISTPASTAGTSVPAYGHTRTHATPSPLPTQSSMRREGKLSTTPSYILQTNRLRVSKGKTRQLRMLSHIESPARMQYKNLSLSRSSSERKIQPRSILNDTSSRNHGHSHNFDYNDDDDNVIDDRSLEMEINTALYDYEHGDSIRESRDAQNPLLVAGSITTGSANEDDRKDQWFHAQQQKIDVKRMVKHDACKQRVLHQNMDRLRYRNTQINRNRFRKHHSANSHRNVNGNNGSSKDGDDSSSFQVQHGVELIPHGVSNHHPSSASASAASAAAAASAPGENAEGASSRSVSFLTQQKRVKGKKKSRSQTASLMRYIMAKKQIDLTTFTEAQKEKARDMFDMLDVDNSGGLEFAEIAQAMSELGLDTDERVINKLLQPIDVDGSRCVDFDEFCVGFADLLNWDAMYDLRKWRIRQEKKDSFDAMKAALAHRKLVSRMRRHKLAAEKSKADFDARNGLGEGDGKGSDEDAKANDEGEAGRYRKRKNRKAGVYKQERKTESGSSAQRTNDRILAVYKRTNGMNSKRRHSFRKKPVRLTCRSDRLRQMSIMQKRHNEETERDKEKSAQAAATPATNTAGSLKVDKFAVKWKSILLKRKSEKNKNVDNADNSNGDGNGDDDGGGDKTESTDSEEKKDGDGTDSVGSLMKGLFQKMFSTDIDDDYYRKACAGEGEGDEEEKELTEEEKKEKERLAKLEEERRKEREEARRKAKAFEKERNEKRSVHSLLRTSMWGNAATRMMYFKQLSNISKREADAMDEARAEMLREKTRKKSEEDRNKKLFSFKGDDAEGNENGGTSSELSSKHPSRQSSVPDTDRCTTKGERNRGKKSSSKTNSQKKRSTSNKSRGTATKGDSSNGSKSSSSSSSGALWGNVNAQSKNIWQVLAEVHHRENYDNPTEGNQENSDKDSNSSSSTSSTQGDHAKNRADDDAAGSDATGGDSTHSQKTKPRLLGLFSSQTKQLGSINENSSMSGGTGGTEGDTKESNTTRQGEKEKNETPWWHKKRKSDEDFDVPFFLWVPAFHRHRNLNIIMGLQEPPRDLLAEERKTEARKKKKEEAKTKARLEARMKVNMRLVANKRRHEKEQRSYQLKSKLGGKRRIFGMKRSVVSLDEIKEQEEKEEREREIIAGVEKKYDQVHGGNRRSIKAVKPPGVRADDNNDTAADSDDKGKDEDDKEEYQMTVEEKFKASKLLHLFKSSSNKEKGDIGRGGGGSGSHFGFVLNNSGDNGQGKTRRKANSSSSVMNLPDTFGASARGLSKLSRADLRDLLNADGVLLSNNSDASSLHIADLHGHAKDVAHIYGNRTPYWRNQRSKPIEEGAFLDSEGYLVRRWQDVTSEVSQRRRKAELSAKHKMQGRKKGKGEEKEGSGSGSRHGHSRNSSNGEKNRRREGGSGTFGVQSDIDTSSHWHKKKITKQELNLELNKAFDHAVAESLAEGGLV